MNKQKIISDVANYYTQKLQAFGATAKGVDWNSSESQELRFNQLLKLIESNIPEFSILDYGCGYGAMFPFIKNLFDNKFSFVGYDISEKMISQAKKLYNVPKTQWINQLNAQLSVDYIVASGIFNVRLEHQYPEWEAYILDTLKEFSNLSKKGFAFNVLTSFSDKEYKRDDLYYANPTFYFDYCKKHFSKYVALLHDYPLYEFTILVKKT